DLGERPVLRQLTGAGDTDGFLAHLAALGVDTGPAVVAAPVSPAELTAARRVLTEAADRGYRAAAAALAEERERRWRKSPTGPGRRRRRSYAGCGPRYGRCWPTGGAGSPRSATPGYATTTWGSAGSWPAGAGSASPGRASTAGRAARTPPGW